MKISAHDVGAVVAFDVHIDVYFCYEFTIIIINLEKFAPREAIRIPIGDSKE